MGNYDLLIQKIDAFIRKYYANQLLRGVLLTLSCLLIYILVVGLGEYFFYFPSWVKIVVVGLLILVGSIAAVTLIVLPLLRTQRLGKVISHEQAAQIIGKHFPEVSDRLLNILQLRNNNDLAASRDLIEAGIEQKSAQIAVVPFLKAIDLGKNKRYLPYALPPALILLALFIASPDMFRDTSARLFQPTKDFQRPAPFSFTVDNKEFKIARYDNYTLNVSVSGKELPQRVFVVANGEEIEMESKGKNRFSYTFAHVAQEINFYLNAAGFSSEPYKIAIIQKPQLQGFEAEILYPAYTGKKSETLKSLSDMSVPEGTVIQWHINTQNTELVTIRYGSQGTPMPLTRKANHFATKGKFTRDTTYTFTISSNQIPNADSFTYKVQVLPDLVPQIMLEEIKDSLSGQQILLSGTASDDYGISRAVFHYAISDAQNKIIAQRQIPLKFNQAAIVPIQHYFDIGVLELEPGQQVSYYVEAWDNDAVNGSKSARSSVFTYSMLGRQAIDSAINQTAEQINKGLSNSSEQALKLQREMKAMQNQLLQSDGTNWEKQESMKALLDKQQQLKNQIEAIKKRFDQQQKQSEQKNYSEDLKEKQEALEKQLDNLLDKQLADQMKKLQEMLQEMNKDKAFQNLQQMEQQNKLFNMDLERIQELMKQLEMQMKMEDIANKLDDLAKQQEQIQNKTEQQSKANSELAKEQKNLQKGLQQMMQQDMKQLEQLNNQQKKQQEFGDIQEQGKQANDNMEQSSDGLEQNQNSKASDAQQKAKQNLQQMAEAMRQKASGLDLKQLDIDIKATRQILTNLIRFSFDQENLMKKVKQTPVSSPNYVSNVQEQNRLAGNARMIKDSLFVLSKRLFDLAATVNKETSDLESSIKQTTSSLEQRRVSEAVTRQQYAMTSANNLALLLNEMLSNLLQMQAQAMQQSGDASCSKPGSGAPKPGKNGKPSPGDMMKDIITGQQQLGKGLQQMKGEGGEKGGQPNKGNEGGQGEGEGNAEQLAQLAQQQAALRRQIQELNSMLNSKGMGGNARLLKEIQEKMDRIETDLVNRRTAGQLQQRHREIMTRLLEAEKAIREQEEDNKRTANAGKNEQRPMPPELKEYLQSRQSLLDLYKTTPPPLKPYYKKMAETYLNEVKAN